MSDSEVDDTNEDKDIDINVEGSENKDIEGTAIKETIKEAENITKNVEGSEKMILIMSTLNFLLIDPSVNQKSFLNQNSVMPTLLIH